MSLDQVLAMLAGLSDEERHRILRTLRQDFGVSIHPLETAWRTTAEAILEAIHTSPDLTQRGVRGILAEATFRTTVVPEQLNGWESVPIHGDLPYDLLLSNHRFEVKVQVKNQRRERGEPKIDRRLTDESGCQVYVVETQRTRNGQAPTGNGEAAATRPYRFGEFDLLAVCLQPSSGIWTDFIYCAGHRLLARPHAPTLLKVMQPVYSDCSRGWTRDFSQAAEEAMAHANGM